MPVMLSVRRSLAVLTLFASGVVSAAQTNGGAGFARGPNQPVDQSYADRIKQYTTQPYFNSPLTDYLPASPTVPTPAKVLGDVSGAPGILPYAEDVYAYFRMLEKSTP